jgi:effector-binding domain-containing protein
MKITLFAALFVILCSFLWVGCGGSRLNYESASYKTVAKAEKFEIRDYPALAVASTSTVERSGTASDDGQFMRLFGYISGKNESDQKIPMTTPVFMANEPKKTKMSFVLPSEMKSAPTPKSDAVKLENIPARKMAVVRYSGGSGQVNEQKYEGKLREWMKEQGHTPSGEAIVAYYDPPWTLPAFRRNEVLIPIK